MDERIEFVAGYPDYAVSNLGYVISCKYGKERALRWNTNHRGYRYVILCQGGKTKNLRIHRLVAEAFIPNPLGLPQVNHLDADKTNNAAWNLEWATEKLNMEHAWVSGIFKTRLTKADTGLIFSLREKGMIQREIAELIGCSQKHVSAILHGKHQRFTRNAA